MQQLVLNIEESRLAKFLQLIRSLNYVQVVQQPQPIALPAPKPKYNFSDLVGKLEWKGDAVAEQRRLRDEW